MSVRRGDQLRRRRALRRIVLVVALAAGFLWLVTYHPDLVCVTGRCP